MKSNTHDTILKIINLFFPKCLPLMPSTKQSAQSSTNSINFNSKRSVNFVWFKWNVCWLTESMALPVTLFNIQ